jgi:serine/threonine-protein kinase
MPRAGDSPRRSPSADVETQSAPTSFPPSAAPDPTTAFANGSIVAGKYLVEEAIAEGGIGVVVVARHLALQQRVAIKYLKPKTLTNPTLVERFVREARLSAQLTSEHVVRVYDVGTLPEAGPYMVMEYLVGEDLGQTVQAGPLPAGRAVDYVLQACDALAEAHALGIVHRDIKPDNMFLAKRASATPVLKIIDFGISKVSPRRGDDNRWATDTGASERFGTPLYMSPEQLRSTSSVDARTDIWSLGVVLHELLTGTLPFPGADLPQVCTSVLTASPARIRTLRPEIPPGLESTVLRCLEKSPARRFRDVGELARALVPFGPASAADRADRIEEVVRRAGESLSGAPRRTAPASAEGYAMASTDARAVTTVHVRSRPAPPGKVLAAVGAGVVCVTGIALAGLARAPALTLPHAVPLAESSRATVAPTASAPGAASHEPTALPPAAASGDPPPLAPSPAALAHTKPVLRARPATTAGATARPAMPVAPAGDGSSRRAQFGERE